MRKNYVPIMFISAVFVDLYFKRFRKPFYLKERHASSAEIDKMNAKTN